MNKYDTQNFVRALYAKRPLPLSPKENMTEAEREAWRKELKAKVTELMAFSEERYEEPRVNLLCRKDRGAYFVEKYEISPEPDLWMSFLLLVPKTATANTPAPGVLCAPGTLWRKECLAAEEFFDLSYQPSQPPTGLAHRYYYANAMAQHYALHGMVALATDDIGSGEHGGSVHPSAMERFLTAQGRSMMGVTVELRLAMLRFLKSLPYVDNSRLAVSGHSLGVDSLMHVALLDEDVKAFVYNDYACDWQERILASCPPETHFFCEWHVYPGVHKYYSYIDLLSAFAPRKLFITEGGRTEYLTRLASVWKELGAAENFRYDYYPDYADPACRKDDEPLSEGMTLNEYLDASNVRAEMHFFKFETAVPWLKEALR